MNPELLRLSSKLSLDHEGLRLTPYHCTAGKLTIGVGRNIADKGFSLEELWLIASEQHYSGTRFTKKMHYIIDVDVSKGISERVALVLLRNDLLEVWAGLTRAQPWLKKLDNVRLLVPIDMGLCMGVRGALNFDGMFGALKEGSWKRAAWEILHNDSGGPSRFSRTHKRRSKRLAQMLYTGALPKDVFPN